MIRPGFLSSSERRAVEVCVRRQREDHGVARLTGTEICGLHRHDLFLEAIRNMLSDTPLSCRKLAARLDVTKDTVWRWRMIILEALAEACDKGFSGVVEVDETYQRESRKGSREWANHAANANQHPAPPRPQWYVFRSGRIKMARGLSKWQIPLLKVVDRGGRRPSLRSRTAETGQSKSR